MAKKLAAGQKANKSEEIRQLLRSGVHKPTEVAAKLAERGITVSPQMVSTIKSKMSARRSAERLANGEPRPTAMLRPPISKRWQSLSWQCTTWVALRRRTKCSRRWRSSSPLLTCSLILTTVGDPMTRPTPSYRDAYKGRGKYAIENNAMLDQEQLRLNAWEGESTRYKPVAVPLFFVGARCCLFAPSLRPFTILGLAIEASRLDRGMAPLEKAERADPYHSNPIIEKYAPRY